MPAAGWEVARHHARAGSSAGLLTCWRLREVRVSTSPAGWTTFLWHQRAASCSRPTAHLGPRSPSNGYPQARMGRWSHARGPAHGPFPPRSAGTPGPQSSRAGRRASTGSHVWQYKVKFALQFALYVCKVNSIKHQRRPTEAKLTVSLLRTIPDCDPLETSL